MVAREGKERRERENRRAEGGLAGALAEEHSEVVVQQVDVPGVVNLGENVELECHYEISGNLYSIKWYLNDREFFRYQPEEETNIMIFHIPGVNVNREMSVGRRVKLDNVQLGASGMYKCEVIGEGPQFLTSDKHAKMMVVKIPEEKPTIYGTQHEYKIGDTARLTCVSAPSHPPASLTWYINDNIVPEKYVTPMDDSHSLDGMVEARRVLQFVVGPQHFVNGQMKLRCSASISTLYYKTQQHSVDGHHPYNVPVMESRDHSAMAGADKARLPGSGCHLAVLVLVTLTVGTLLQATLS
ncbi:hypothetical protein O3P69_015053 [Scylla paramamosain]|uniref:Ig-like domain-containing protein n=1 Tax=Scylla paramamosain TaxID=85552 RepID=A0AAW0T2N9_SCYPA